MDNEKDLKLKIESATFKKFLDHLNQNPEIQNIDLMILADFCRNCISKWYIEAAKKSGVDLTYDESREIIYGIPYKEWKEKFQK